MGFSFQGVFFFFLIFLSFYFEWKLGEIAFAKQLLLFLFSSLYKYYRLTIEILGIK